MRPVYYIFKTNKISLKMQPKKVTILFPNKHRNNKNGENVQSNYAVFDKFTFQNNENVLPVLSLLKLKNRIQEQETRVPP